MRKIREILRLYHEMGLSRRKLPKACRLPTARSGDVLRRAEGAGLGWSIPDNMTWDDVEQLLYPGNTGKPRPGLCRNGNRFTESSNARNPLLCSFCGMNTSRQTPMGSSIANSAPTIANGVRKLDVVMRQTHRAGEKMFVDFAGETVPIVDPASGEIEHA